MSKIFGNKQGNGVTIKVLGQVSNVSSLIPDFKRLTVANFFLKNTSIYSDLALNSGQTGGRITMSMSVSGYNPATGAVTISASIVDNDGKYERYPVSGTSYSLCVAY